MAEPQQVIQTQTSIAPEAKPELAQLLANLGAYTQPSGYETYGGIRTPEFSALQQQAFLAAQGLQPSWQTDIASDIAQRAAAQAGGARYRPGEFRSRFNAPAAYRARDFESGFQAPEDYRASRYRSEYEAPEDYQAQQFRSTYRAPGQDFGLAAAQQYMSPYMQSVVDMQQREAQRAADIATQARHAQAVKAGAYGGSSQAILDAEAARNLALQKADIQAQGLQAAYSQAQQQFNADQARRAQEAAQAAQYGMAAQQATEASRQFGYGQEAQQAQLAAQLGLSSAQLREASRQFGYGQNLTAEQMAAQMQMAEQQAEEQARQYGYGQRMTAAGLGAQYGSEADRMREASRQFGATFGQQGQAAAINAANLLGDLGQTAYGQQTGILGLQSQLGGQQYTREQGILDTAYQDFVNQRMYPLQMLGIQSDILRGLPTSSIQNIYARPPSATAQGFGLLATGVGALGKFGGWGGGQPTGSAAGGEIKSRTAGLADIAMRKIEA